MLGKGKQKMRRGPKVHMGRRYDVSAWVPSEGQVNAAAERTEGMVNYFLVNARREWPQWMDDLYVLARSCYLQGANDTAKVAAEMLGVHGVAQNFGQYPEGQPQPAEVDSGRRGIPECRHDKTDKRKHQQD